MGPGETLNDGSGDGEDQGPSRMPCLGTARRCTNLFQESLATLETWESCLTSHLVKNK